MRFELICCPMSGVIELGSVKPPCRPHLSPDGGRWGNTLIGALLPIVQFLVWRGLGSSRW